MVSSNMDDRPPHADALLASDLDGTLIPVDADPGHPAAVARFRELLAARPGLRLAYVTGRAADDALAATAACGLPLPHVLVCDVGTRILWSVPGGWRDDDEYHARALAAMGGIAAAEIVDAVTAASAFEPQEPSRQSDVKISFRLPASHDGDAALETVRDRLADLGWRLALVASRCVFTGDVLLDVLPGGVDKATAVQHVRKELRLGADAVLYAGDSGNDLAPLTAGFNAVVVSNAAPGLADRILAFAAAEGRPRTVHVASRPHLHGVLEGASRFGIL